MGYYTRFHFEAKLKSDTPKRIIHLLNQIINDAKVSSYNIKGPILGYSIKRSFIPINKHPFFECQRWYMLFHGKNFGKIPDTKFYRSPIGINTLYLKIDSEFKNYDDEIEKFIDFISPYVLGRKKKKYVGWYQGENYEIPRINIYINQQIKK